MRRWVWWWGGGKVGRVGTRGKCGGGGPALWGFEPPRPSLLTSSDPSGEVMGVKPLRAVAPAIGGDVGARAVAGLAQRATKRRAWEGRGGVRG